MEKTSRYSPYSHLETDPTPEEIAERCQRIQETWSAEERRKRAPWAYAQPIEYLPAKIDRRESA